MPEKLTVAQAAASLGINYRALQQRIRRGLVPVERIGGTGRRCNMLIGAADVEAERVRTRKKGQENMETFTFEDGCIVTVTSDIVDIESGDYHTNSAVDFYYSAEGGLSSASEVADLYHRNFCHK